KKRFFSISRRGDKLVVKLVARSEAGSLERNRQDQDQTSNRTITGILLAISPAPPTRDIASRTVLATTVSRSSRLLRADRPCSRPQKANRLRSRPCGAVPANNRLRWLDLWDRTLQGPIGIEANCHHAS